MREGDSGKKILTKLDLRIVAAIIGFSVVYQALNSYYGPTDELNVFVIIGIAGLVPCFVLSFVASKRYSGSEIFGKAYFALGIAFLMYFMGDIAYYYYDYVLHEAPYPSFADFFYLAYEPFVLYHLVKNIRYFRRKFDALTKAWLVALPVVIVVSYASLSYSDMGGFNFDFYYSLIFVVAASIPFPFAILGTMVFRHSVLASVWSLLATGISLNIFADVWYYYLELFGEYTDAHPVYVFWVVGYAFVIYALIKHQRSI